ncbi:MAG: hypothetical protein Fur0021_13180 [Candidatus Promineifilaceae bacterium]
MTIGAQRITIAAVPLAMVALQNDAAGIFPGWIGWLILGLSLLLSLAAWLWYRQK